MPDVSALFAANHALPVEQFPAKIPPATGFQDALSEAVSHKPGASGDKLADVARQFEGLMVGQILKMAHSSGSAGLLGTGEEDQAGDTAIEMAQEYLGQALANGGGLGIAKIVQEGLARRVQE